MIINHNIAALNTHRQMGSASNAQMSSMEKLSSGLRINSAKDDAAGLSISEKMRGQIRGLEQASSNAQDGISLMQTAEGALNETHSILQRMRELATQASNDTLQPKDRAAIQTEVDELASEITRIADDTQFNGKSLIGSGAGDQFSGKIQIGANANQTLQIDLNAMDAFTLEVGVNTTKTPAEVTEISVVSTSTPTAAAAFTNGAFDLTDYSSESDLDIKVKVTDAGKAEFTITKDGQTYKTTADVTSDTGTSAATSKFVLNNSINGLENVFKAGDSITIELEDAATVDDEVNVNIKGAISGDVEGIDLSNHTKATAAITTIDSAIETVSEMRSTLGAWSNRLEHTINNLGTSAENLTSAESRIRDVDYAEAA